MSFYALSTGQSRLSLMSKKSDPKYDRIRASFELVTYRLSLIRALYVVSVASNSPRHLVHAEFHQALGDILEGMALSRIDLSCIDKRKVIEEASWLHQHKD